MKEVNFLRAPFDFLAHIKCYTGYCGSESTETFIVVAGTDIDALGLEMANENATSHGLDGQEVCASCGEEWGEDEDDNCSRCGHDGSEWEESDSVEGNVIFWRPSHLGSCYNSIEDILGFLVELGAVEINATTIRLFSDILENVIDLTEDGANDMLYNYIREEYLHHSIIWGEKTKIIGKRFWNNGWSINELITACRESREAEVSLDEILGGDGATSEVIVHDLIAYIRELEGSQL